MATFSKSQIFKAAWINVKTNKVSLSFALKTAWAEAKAPKVVVSLYTEFNSRSGEVDVFVKEITGKYSVKQIAKVTLSDVNYLELKNNNEASFDALVASKFTQYTVKSVHYN